MRTRLLLIACLAPMPLAAQEQAPLEVDFDLAAQRPATEPEQAKPVMVQFDLNGNPIAPLPAGQVTETGVAAEDSSAESWGLDAFLTSQPESTYSRSGGQATASEQTGRASSTTRVERETSQSCTETMFETTCRSSGSVTIGNSAEGRNAAREALDRVLRDD